MERDNEEKLRQKLEALKRDLARKKSKIKNIERSKSAKEHVKKKIEEHRSKSSSEDDLFTQKSIKRMQPHVQTEVASGSTAKPKTSHVSFDLPKVKGEEINKGSSESGIDIPSKGKEKSAVGKVQVNQKKQFEIPCSQDEFKDLSRKVVTKNRAQSLRKKPTSVLKSSPQFETTDKTGSSEINSNVKNDPIPFTTESENALKSSVTTTQCDSPKLPNTYPQDCSKNRVEESGRKSKILSGTTSLKYNDHEGAVKLARNQKGKRQQTKKTAVSDHTTIRDGIKIHPAAMKPEPSGEVCPSNPKLPAADDSSTLSLTPNKIIDLKCDVSTDNSPETFAETTGVDGTLKTEAAAPTDLPTGSSVDTSFSGATGAQRPKKRTRGSSTMLDFSFLDEEDSGDMYSQIKSRRRGRGRHSLPADLQSQGGGLLGLSQEDGGSQYSGYSQAPGMMPKLSHGLSQPSQRVVHGQGTDVCHDKDVLDVQSEGKSSEKPNCKKAVHVTSTLFNPKSVLQPLDVDAQSQCEFQQVKGKRRGSTTLAKGGPKGKVKGSPLIHSCPPLGYGGPVDKESPLHSTYPVPRRRRKSTQRLMMLPHTNILKNITNFELPEEEYGQLKETKIKLNENEEHSLAGKNTGETLEEKGNTVTATNGWKSKNQKLIELPPKETFKTISHFVLPDAEYGLLKLNKIEYLVEKNNLEVFSTAGKTNSSCPSPSVSASLRSVEGSGQSAGTSSRLASTGSARRRRSVKLSPIKKLTDDPIMVNTHLDELTLVDSDIVANSQVVTQSPDVGSHPQRKVGRGGRNSQTRKKKKGNLEKSVKEGGAIKITQSSTLSQTVLNEDTVCESDQTTQNSAHDGEDPLNTGLLDDTLVSMVVAGDNSCELDKVNTAESSSGLHQVSTVQLPNGNGAVLCIDAVQGYIRGERGVVVALAGSHQLQIWCLKDKLPWNLIHSWNIGYQSVKRLHIVATGDVIAVMVVTKTAVEVYGYIVSGTVWTWTLHENTSLQIVDVLCFAVGDSMLVADVGECGSTVVRYKLSEDWQSCRQTAGVAEVPEQLVSLMAIRGQQGALLGASTEHLFIWNYTESILLLKMSLPSPLSHCFSAVAEHGLVFMWLSAEGQPPCLVVVNPNTTKSVIATSVDQPPGQVLNRISCVSVDAVSVMGISADNRLQLWEAASGSPRGPGLKFDERLTCLSPVRGSKTGDLLVLTARELRHYQPVR